jgi:hypothetical protein
MSEDGTVQGVEETEQFDDDEGMDLARDDATYIEPPLGQDALVPVVEGRRAAPVEE